MPIYTIHGCTVEVAKGGQSASVSRVEIKDAEGNVVQSAARQSFQSLPTITAQVQAQRWARALPAIITPAAPVVRPAKKDAN